MGSKKYMINFALEPEAKQFDPLWEIFPDSKVEHGLESFYKLK